MTPPACGTPGCDRPAVATVTVSPAGIRIRTDRLGDPRTAQAWADDLRCWGCVTGAVDHHLTTTSSRETS
ncbi:hypothetical protein [Verrucosispora sp. NA02020]|uniref:hypothetical protein n=1 Tax=Verrucosispora sp. NA02020 TaxID=2742132 RepID=UPI003D74F397